MGLRFEYEPEGFDFGDGIRYLPDFWLPTLQMWAEVKAVNFTEEERDKLKRLVAETEKRGFLLIGPPSEEEQQFLVPYIYETQTDAELVKEYYSQPCVKNAKGHFVFLMYDSGDVAFSGMLKGLPMVQRNYEGLQTPQVVNAVAASRAARFEFGESG